MIGVIIFIAVTWSFFGALLLVGVAADGGNLPFEAEGFEFVNPAYIYKHCRVNVFGAIVVTIFTSLICPIGTIIYWFYKLCTIGRNEDDVEYF